MNTAYIGLGSNLGNRKRMLEEALRLLDGLPDISVTDVSPIYETDPIGILDQPRFLNAAARLSTPFSPQDLLDSLLGIELQMGRKRERKWGPRTIDLDLLLYESAIIHHKDLIVPHPFLAERLFVLAPLCDLDDKIVHPILMRTLRELLGDLTRQPLMPVDGLSWKRGGNTDGKK